MNCKILEKHLREVDPKLNPNPLYNRYFILEGIIRPFYSDDVEFMCKTISLLTLEHAKKGEELTLLEFVFPDGGDEGYVTYCIENTKEIEKLMASK